jgi:hypothetical protein
MQRRSRPSYSLFVDGGKLVAPSMSLFWLLPQAGLR